MYLLFLPTLLECFWILSIVVILFQNFRGQFHLRRRVADPLEMVPSQFGIYDNRSVAAIPV